MFATERPLTDAETDRLMGFMQAALEQEIVALRLLHTGVTAAETNKRLIDKMTGFSE